MSKSAHEGAVSVSLILVPVRHRLVPFAGQSSTHWPQIMPWPIRRTKLRAPASVFNPRVRRAQGLKRAQKPPCATDCQSASRMGPFSRRSSRVPFGPRTTATAAGPPAGRAPGWGPLPARPATTWQHPPRSPAKPGSVAGSGHGRCACTGWPPIPGRTADAGGRSRQAAGDRCRCGACVWHRNGTGSR